MKQLWASGHKLSRQILVIGLSAAFLVFSYGSAQAASPLQATNPQNGSLGIEGTLNGPPPSTAPTISTPGNNQTFNAMPITIAGLCTKGLIVKVFSNNVFIGSAYCAAGTYSIQASLFNGLNTLVARHYDGLDQAGPNSNTVNVTYTLPANYTSLLSITSQYATRGTNPGSQLSWPITISGGTAPYALSIDWGDNSTPQLLSEATAGNVTLTHTYNNAGTYTITIEGTDKNGQAAFLQVVAVINGAVVSTNGGSSTTTITKTSVKIIWWPCLLMIPLIIAAFWVGKREELYDLQEEAEKASDTDVDTGSH